VVRVRRVLNLNRFQPGVLSGRLVKVTVDADVTLGHGIIVWRSPDGRGMRNEVENVIVSGNMI